MNNVKLDERILTADCVYESGVFHLYRLPAHLPDVCTVRFVAPRDYASGENFGVDKRLLRTRAVNASGFGFKAGDIVHVELDLPRELVFAGASGGADVDISHLASKDYVDTAIAGIEHTGCACFTCIGVYSAGTFVMAPLAPLPSPLPALFSLRFKAPAAFTAGDVLRLSGMDYPFRDQDNAALATGAFASGVVVEVQVGEGAAFFRHGGGAVVDPGTGWNIFPGQSPNPDSVPGLYVPDATLPSAIEIDCMLKTSGSTIKQVACGGHYTVFVLADGSVWNCGYNDNGQLGRVTASGSPATANLERLAGISDVAAVGCGQVHTVFLKTDGTVWSCGRNDYEQLGRTVATGSETVANLGRVDAISDVKSIAVGYYHTAFLKTDDTVWNCGHNMYGQLGRAAADGSVSSINLGRLMAEVKSVACGGYNTALIKTDGTLWNCGHNDHGQLGRVTANGSQTTINLAQLTTVANVASVTCGSGHTVFLKTDGTVWNCGWNALGQLGRVTEVHGSTTVVNLGQLSAMTDVSAVYGGLDHTVFVKADGTVWSCGYNNHGQLGHTVPGHMTMSNLVQVAAMKGATAMSGGELHSVFIKADKTVWSCGSNRFGQLGRVVDSGSETSSNLGRIAQFGKPYPEGLLFIAVGQPGANGALLREGYVRQTIPIGAVYQIRGGQAVELPFRIQSA